MLSQRHFSQRMILANKTNRSCLTNILAGNGFRISEARNCIKIVEDIRKATPIGLVGDYHPLAEMPLAKHPFGWDDVKY